MADQIIRIFVSSPGDVGPEREAVDRVVADLNARLGGSPLLKTVRWEKSFYSAHSTFQSQIVDPAHCDLVVTLFWTRLGSELPPDFEKQPDGSSWPSGTVFEMARALEANRATNGATPDVLVYRKTKEAPLPTDDLTKRRQALAEFERFATFWQNWFVSEQGHFKAAFKTFVDLEPFEKLLKADLHDWLKARGHLRSDTTWDISHRGSPFRGLQRFEAEHCDVFFGRAHAIERGLRALRDAAARGAPFLLVAGDSGTGKSSLARAGLLPRLTKPGVIADVEMWRTCAFDFGAGEDAFAHFAEALFAALPELSESDFSIPPSLAGHFARGGGPEPVLRALLRAAKDFGAIKGFDRMPHARLAVLADQLERLFLLPAPQRDVMASLIAALTQTGAVFVVATLRIDALGPFLAQDAFKSLAEQGGRLDLAPPGPDEIGDMVRGPAQAAGLTYETDASGDLDDAIVEAARGADVLPLLQFALEELFRARDANVMTKAAYAALGGLEGAIGRQAERAFAPLPDDAKGRLPRLLRSLVETGKTGLALVAAPRAKLETTPQDKALVAALLDARILVAGGGAQGGTVRLAHEAVLRAWPEAARQAAANAAFYRVRDEVAADLARWQAEGLKSDRLIRSGAALKQAQDLVAGHGDEIDADMKAFIKASTRRARRLQTALVAATGVFAATAALAGFKFFEAERERARAEASFVAARTTLDSVTANVVQGLRNSPGLKIERLQAILDDLGGAIGHLAASAPDDRHFMQSRAAMLSEIGITQESAGALDAALGSYRDALALIERQLALQPDDLARRRDSTTVRSQIGGVLFQQGDNAGALNAYREALGIAETWSARTPDDMELRRAVGLDHGRIGKVLSEQGDHDAALAEFGKSLEVAQALVARDANPLWRGDLSLAYSRIGGALQNKGDLDGALANYRKCAEINEPALKADPGNTAVRHGLSIDHGNIGQALHAKGDHEGALASHAKALALAEKLVDADPDNIEWLGAVGDINMAMGDAAVGARKVAEAEKAFNAGLEARELVVGRDPDNAPRQASLAEAQGKVAMIKEAKGDLAGAKAGYSDSLASYEKLLARNPDDADALDHIAEALDMLADVADKAGDKAGAAAARKRAAALKAGAK